MLMLPPLRQVPSPNCSSRGGARVNLVVVHDCEGNYDGSVGWFAMARSRVSANVVLRADGMEATQCVPWPNKAWAQCDYNPQADSLELAGFAAKGFGEPEWMAAASIIAWRLHQRGLPPTWAKGGVGDGFCSHHDLGARGGSHTDPCDIGDQTWMTLVDLVQKAYAMPQPAAWAGDRTPVAPPALPANFAPSATIRHDLAQGSLEWVQMHLNALGFAKPVLTVDGMMGPNTERAVAAFQQAKGLYVDGDPGPDTIAALS